MGKVDRVIQCILVFLFTQVELHVTPQVLHEREALTAHVTHVLLLLRVRQIVELQVLLRGRLHQHFTLYYAST